MRAITEQETTTYHVVFGNKRRRFLTKHAAYVWLAKQMVLASDRWACTCEAPEYDSGYPGCTCPYHSGDADALVLRLVRWLKHRDRVEVAS